LGKHFIYSHLRAAIRQTAWEHPASCWCLSNQSERALGRRRRSCSARALQMVHLPGVTQKS
jgi:hypothetical protein